MGALDSLPQTTTAGNIYFAKDGNKNFGELYYDDANGNRIKIAPSVSDLSNYYNNGILTTKVILEDNSIFESIIPLASDTASGIVSTVAQTFAGNKTFNDNVSIKKLTITNTGTPQIQFSRDTYNYLLAPTDSAICFCMAESVTIDKCTMVINKTSASPGKNKGADLGAADKLWNNIYSNKLISTDIEATNITASKFTGALVGNASTATTLQTGRNINGTLFDGSEDITTDSWGTSRTISINSKAGTTGTAIDGSEDISLIIPSTMTNFVSITSTTYLGTNLGSTTEHITSGRINDLYIYNSNSSGYTQLKRDETSTTSRTLNLPAASGRLTYIGSTAIGGTGQPVYAAATGLITACTAVSVSYGGTGKTSLDNGKALIGAGTNAVTLRSITNNTSKTAVTASTNLVTANTLYYHSGNSNLTTVGTISSGTWNGTTIAVGYGGTGTTTAPKAGGIIYGSSTTAYACSNAGTSGYLLQSGGTGAPTWIQPTDANTGNTIVKRDTDGNFSAGTITGTLNGNASTSSRWETAIVFDGMSLRGDAARYSYGTCSTAAATAAKTVTCFGFVLVAGSEITVKFTVTNTAANPTLNVNSTGAKAIYYNGAAITASYLAANKTYTFRYNGTQYDLVGDINTQSNTDNSKKDAVQCSTASGTAAKVGTAAAYNLSNNRYFFVLMENANSYKGAITLNINSSGAKTIYINGSASSSSNYTLPAGLYHVYYDGTYYRFRTNSTFLDGCFTRSYINTTTSNTNYYLLGASGTGDQSLYRAYNSSGSANKGGCYFNGSTGVLYGAAWNDYAEFRTCNDNFIPGQVVKENGDDTLQVTKCRLERGCSIISDTFGFAIGETEKAKCPIAVSGRVLAYPYESRDEFKKYIGYPVCSGPYGTVSIMTEEEEKLYPSCVIGTISAVPEYEFWGQNNVEVNNRVWIKIK